MRAAKMNVPLKKRHNYGINGSASSMNEPPSAKRLHSTNNSNDEDDSNEYDEHQSSNLDDDDDDDDSSEIGANTTMAHIGKEDRKQPHQYLSIGNRAASDGNKTIRYNGRSTDGSSSSSVITASTHNSSKRNENKTSSSSSDSSDSSGSSKESASDAAVSDVLDACDPLTEENVLHHNTALEPMTSKERIDFWNCADEFNEIEDDFDDKKYFSKPIRSERLQKRMYTQPVPNFSTSRKYKKDEKSRKTDDKPSASTPKSKADPKEANKTKASPTKRAKKSLEKSSPPPPPPPAKSPIQSPKVEQRPIAVAHSVLLSPVRPLLNNTAAASRPNNEIPSAIKFRVSYGKDTSIRSDNSFKVPTTPNTSSRTLNEGSCANCIKHSRNIDKPIQLMSSSTEIPVNNQEEFYKYLGIDTHPTLQEKVSPEPSPNDALYNNRRSLRVFIQQKQHEFSRSNEKLTKDDHSPHQKSPTIQKSHSPNSVHRQSPENGKVFSKSPVMNGGAKKTNVISSHIKKRHAYDMSAGMEGDIQTQNTTCTMPTTSTSSNSFNETEANRFGESSMAGQSTGDKPKVQRIQKRKILLPSPMMLTEMFKRYKQCFKHGFAMQQRQQMVKRVKKRPSNNIQTTKTLTQAENSDKEKPAKINGVQKSNVVQQIINTSEHFVNSFSPTSITHSNASTDSAIVVYSNVNDICTPTVTVNSSCSLQWQPTNHTDKTQFQNPLDMKNNGAVHAILTHSVSLDESDVVIVVQESQISYWYSTSKALSMFGIARSWTKIGEIPRLKEDKEIDALYQHRLIDLGEEFPAYVEMRAKESLPDEFRQANLTFVYLNVYFVKLNADRHPQIVMERVNLDTLKGNADSIYYTALSKTSPSILMTWTEHNVNNQTRCGIIKYILRMPTLDNVEEIVDYSELQHDIKTLWSISDYHVVGCGDRTVSMWDHRNGNLLIDIEIELPTIGQNIACYTVGDDVPEYMLLIQLTSVEVNGESNKQLKVMAVQTIDPYNWRTLQTHNIPNVYGKIRSIFNKDDMLTITFTSGTMLVLNVSSPHMIYVRNVSWSKPASQTNGLTVAKNSTNGVSHFFTQSNGQTIEMFNDRIAIKSVWEYFMKD